MQEVIRPDHTNDTDPAQLHWPYTMDEALEIDAATGSVWISEHFGQHVSKPENRSLNSYALSLYPELGARIRIKD